MSEARMNAPVLAVFASDKGPGDPERASIMSQAGTYFARRGASIITLAENGVIPVPLITAARTAGGQVQIVGDPTIMLPAALRDVTLESLEQNQDRLERIATSADAFVALPGSLASATALFGAWTAAKAQGRNLPVLMLNRHKAFEVLRGYAADVLSPGLPGYDKAVQFSDTIEDLWSRLSRLLGEQR
ncbi:LOG family protein [Devosia submarina]|uniref:LOG family protein n=1 Tax=Devosia submarina TaxID=1173082 RepID=UPI001300A2EA|nr:LOG family protein [Devosia submarina]